MTGEVTADTAPAQVADTAPEVSTSQDAAQTPEVGTEAITQADEGTSRPSIENSDTQFELPEEYREKSWASKVKSQDDLYKQIDNLSELVGKKVVAPIDYETATAEEIAAHHSSLAPENVSDYEFSDASDPDFSKAVGEVFQKYGIDKYQAKGLEKEINEIAGNLIADRNQANTDAEGYMALMKESFGDDYEKKVVVIDEAMKKFTGDRNEDKAAIDAMDNGTKAVVDRLVHDMHNFYENKIAEFKKEYGVQETSAQVEGETGYNSPVDVEQVRSDLRQKIIEIEARPHTEAEKRALQDKLSATYK